MWDLLKFKSNKALVTEDSQAVTYEELHALTDEIYQAIDTRCLVLSLCSNTIASVVGYVSFIKHQIVPILLSDALAPEQITNFIKSYSPSFIWAPKDKCDALDGAVVFEKLGYVLLKLNAETKPALFDDLALLITTSGSTGSPKLVRISYKSLESNTKAIASYLKLTDSEKAITTLPMNYSYGLSVINTHLSVGATLLLTDKSIMQREFWDFLGKEQATSFAGVPYTYEMLDRLRFYRRTLPSLKTMTQAGGKLSKELQQKLAEYAANEGKEFIVMYGQSEATARISYLPHEQALSKLGSIGIAIPGGSLSILDTNNQEITTPHTQGELLYKGDNVSLGYAESATDLSKGDENCGVLKTGDIAMFDEDGYFYIVGRMKRFLKIFGNRVNLDEVEQLVKHEFSSLDCATCGRDDLMKIFITDESKVKDVKEYVAKLTHLNFTAFKVIFINKILKSESGKTLYAKMDEL